MNPISGESGNQYEKPRTANNFNFLRLMLASLVIVSHAPEIMDGNRDREILSRIFHTISFGELAVDGFFLLSGYLILQSWISNPGLGQYFKKRALRIFPGFIVSSLICAFVIAPLETPVKPYFSEFNIYRFAISLVTLQVPAIPTVHDGLFYPFINGSVWTIAYEFRCYILIALLGLAGVTRNKYLFLAITLTLLVVSVFGEQLPQLQASKLSYLSGSPKSLVRFFSLFLTGGCFFLFRKSVRYTSLNLIIAALLLVIFLFSARWAEVGVALFGGYILFHIAFLSAPRLAFFRTSSDVSYGTYLYAWPIEKLLLFFIPTTSPILLFLETLILSLGAGYLSWHLVEAPAQKLR